MQWLIDIITERVLASMSGIICEWHGLLVDIPDGWALCDGNNGTPDLRTKFLFGAAVQGEMNSTGGAFTHSHPFTSNVHNHPVPTDLQDDITDEGTDITGTDQGDVYTGSQVVTGTTNVMGHVPPYYMLAFIMKL